MFSSNLGFFSHYFFKHSFCPFLSFLPAGTPVIQAHNVVDGIPPVSEAVFFLSFFLSFFFFCYSFFFMLLRLDNLSRPSFKSAEFPSAHLYLQRKLSSEFFILVFIFVYLEF